MVRGEYAYTPCHASPLHDKTEFDQYLERKCVVHSKSAYTPCHASSLHDQTDFDQYLEENTWCMVSMPTHLAMCHLYMIKQTRNLDSPLKDYTPLSLCSVWPDSANTIYSAYEGGEWPFAGGQRLLFVLCLCKAMSHGPWNMDPMDARYVMGCTDMQTNKLCEYYHPACSLVMCAKLFFRYLLISRPIQFYFLAPIRLIMCT